MRPAIARALTHLHSHAWRVRYGDEFEALLLDLPCTPRIVCNSLESAIVSQGGRIAIAAAFTIAIAATLALLGSSQAQHTSLMATRAPVHDAPPCAVYSSVNRREWTERKQCLG